jgi:hypothetical protein
MVSARRCWKSTGQANKRNALQIALAWEAAEREAGRGLLTRDRVAELLNETLRRVGITPQERPTTGAYLAGWLEELDQSSWMAAVYGKLFCVPAETAFAEIARRQEAAGRRAAGVCSQEGELLRGSPQGATSIPPF